MKSGELDEASRMSQIVDTIIMAPGMRPHHLTGFHAWMPLDGTAGGDAQGDGYIVIEDGLRRITARRLLAWLHSA